MHRRCWAGRATLLMGATLLLAAAIAGCRTGKERPTSTSPGPERPAVEAPDAKPSRPETVGDVANQLQAARLLHEPVPASDGVPILRQLVDEGWSVDEPLQAEVKPLRSRVKRWRKIRCHEVRFTSHPWREAPVRIFGFYALPAAAEDKLPGLLLVHGGGGYATLQRVVEAASRGYAAFSIDLPGKGTLRQDRSRSTGPDMTVENIFTVKPELSDNYLYNAVLAQVRSITFLRSRPEIDPERIGMVGVSWGGASGLITTSLDKRIKCFVNMFGSGFLEGGSTWHSYFETLDAGEFDVWQANFDAARYLASIDSPVLALTGSNDNCYYLPRFMKTHRAIEATPALLLRPNLDHEIDQPARNAYFRWLDLQLKPDEAGAAPTLEAFRVSAAEGEVRVDVSTGGQVAVEKAEVCFGEVGEVGWTNRKWVTVSCRPDQARTCWAAQFALPSQTTYVFATVYFDDGAALSTPVHSVAMANINAEPLALNMPFMEPDRMLVEAHALAEAIRAQVAARRDRSGVIITRGSSVADCDARRLEGLYFVPLRDACRQLGGIVHFDKGVTTVSLAAVSKGARPAQREP